MSKGKSLQNFRKHSEIVRFETLENVIEYIKSNKSGPPDPSPRPHGSEDEQAGRLPP
jgi:hypothetical protein